MLVAGLVVILLSVALLVVAHILAQKLRTPEGFLRYGSSRLGENLRLGGIGGLILGLLMSYLGVLLASFTVFTAISIFGVFLGTFLPIVTLSVMSGFETDL